MVSEIVNRKKKKVFFGVQVISNLYVTIHGMIPREKKIRRQMKMKKGEDDTGRDGDWGKICRQKRRECIMC